MQPKGVRRTSNCTENASSSSSAGRVELKLMNNSHLIVVAPSIKKRAVGPTRRPNRELRSREHLTEIEVSRLIAAAKNNRHGHRDSTMLLVAFRHGLRASEIC